MIYLLNYGMFLYFPLVSLQTCEALGTINQWLSFLECCLCTQTDLLPKLSRIPTDLKATCWVISISDIPTPVSRKFLQTKRRGRKRHEHLAPAHHPYSALLLLWCGLYDLHGGLMVGSLKKDPSGSTKNYQNVYTPEDYVIWNLRIHPWKRNLIFQTIIFRFYVNLRGCNSTRNHFRNHLLGNNFYRVPIVETHTHRDYLLPSDSKVT